MPARGSVHALVIGIDDYHHQRKLNGAVNDARLIATALEKVGVVDITVLLDSEATRVAIESAWERMIGMDEASFTDLMNAALTDLQSYHATLHKRVLDEFADISEEELNAPSMYWEGYELSLRFRLHRFDSHLSQHMVQLDKTLPAVGLPPNEAKRLLRLVYAALAEAEGAVIGAWEVGVGLWKELAETISSRADEVSGILA